MELDRTEEDHGRMVDLAPEEAWVLKSIEALGIHIPTNENKANEKSQELASALWGASLVFAQALVKQTVKQCLLERKSDGEPKGERILIPVHVFKVLCSKPEFDIFTNQGLLSGKRANSSV